jgi:hypothetical protein
MDQNNLKVMEAAQRLLNNKDFHTVYNWLVAEWAEITLNCDPNDAIGVQRAHFKYLAICDLLGYVEALEREKKELDNGKP